MSERQEFLDTFKSEHHYIKSGGFEDSGTILANHITYMYEKGTDLRVLKIIWEQKRPDGNIYD